MLDDYRDKQEMAYELLNDSVKSDKISHAYLFETNHYRDAMDFIMAFVKAIVCPYHYTCDKECNGCNICKRIDDGNYMEVKIIKPDGMWIKKDQLLELQEEFTKKGVEGERRVYVIKQCDKMNPQAANSILKFLEEPSENIHAILVTDNMGLLLPTIVSRCQVINLVPDVAKCDRTIDALANLYCTSGSEYDEFIVSESNQMAIQAILDFIWYLEEAKLNTIVYTKRLWHSKFKDKESNIMAFDLMINFYNDVLKVKCGKMATFFVDKSDVILKVSELNSISQLVKKLSILLEMKENIKYNLNANLLVDKLIIDMGGV